MCGWTDPYLTWQRDLEKRKARPGQDLDGRPADRRGARGQASSRQRSRTTSRRPRSRGRSGRARASRAGTSCSRARRAATACTASSRHVARRRSRTAMGFDVLYLPPIHPIGTHARARAATTRCRREPGDVGSPWAIGAAEGGHNAHPPAARHARRLPLLSSRSAKLGHRRSPSTSPSSARPTTRGSTSTRSGSAHRPDGTMQYAENPPKKYQDIYPVRLRDASDWRGAVGRARERRSSSGSSSGVTIFRVDNPHTKPFAFWEWVHRRDRSARIRTSIFLAEAFTRPRVMHQLAKLGFTQSYTYFTWRNTKQELTEYFTELTVGSGRANTSGPTSGRTRRTSCTTTLQHGGRAGVHVARWCWPRRCRRTTASTARPTSCMEHEPREPGQRGVPEFREVRDQGAGISIVPIQPARLHRAIERNTERENAALQSDWSLQLPSTSTTTSADRRIRSRKATTCILVVVNLDPRHAQSGWVELDCRRPRRVPTRSQDLLGGGRYYLWHGAQQLRELNRARRSPAHAVPCAPANRYTVKNAQACRQPGADERSRRRRGALVQGRGHLPAARQGVLRLATATASATSAGLTAKLDYIQDLGVNTIWLLPFYPSPLRGRRLRHRRLPRRASRTTARCDGLPALRARGAPARPEA